MTATQTTPRPKGFAAISPERQREIARMGGAAIPAHRRSFYTNPELAREAGRKGGSAQRKPQ